jgi:hypothetical protein
MSSFADAIAALEPRAAAGDATAQFELGLLFLRRPGHAAAEDGSGGADADHRAACEAASAHWLQSAADAGLADAQFAIGVSMQRGVGGFAQDSERSVFYFGLAADQGDADALFALGCHFAAAASEAATESVHESHQTRAIALLRRAAELQHEPASMALAALLESTTKSSARSRHDKDDSPPPSARFELEPGAAPPLPSRHRHFPVSHPDVHSQRINVDSRESLMNFNPIRGLRTAAPTSFSDSVCSLPASLVAWSEAERELSIDLALTKARNLHIKARASTASASASASAPTVDLSIDEMAAIHLYTQETPFHAAVNVLLRAERRALLQPLLPYLKLLIGALKRLPTQAPCTLYRRSSVDLGATYDRGLEVVWWPLTATDTRPFAQSALVSSRALPDASASFSDSRDDDSAATVFEISARSAMDLRFYSAISGIGIGNGNGGDASNGIDATACAQLCLPPGTRLQVDSVERTPRGVAWCVYILCVAITSQFSSLWTYCLNLLISFCFLASAG